MDASSALISLAEEAGITPEFVDTRGQTQRASASTLQALLRAMGIAADDAAAQQVAAAQLQSQRRAEILPPVAVWRPGVPREVRLQWAGRHHAPGLRFRLQEENGAQHEGAIDLDALDVSGHAANGDSDYAAYRLVLDLALPDGYHRLALLDGEEALAHCVLIVAPAACYQPSSLAAGGRIFGPAAQLYGVRSARNWGIGDFLDLAVIVEQWGAQGADVVGINPLHALFSHDPARASPYSPSSRLHLNPLYLNVEAIVDFAECEEARRRVATEAFQARLGRLRAMEEVDYVGVASAKTEVLRLLCAHFREHHLLRGTPRAEAFRAFVVQGGPALEQLALFEVLQAHLYALDAGAWGWPAWPGEYRDANGPAVQDFIARHRDAIDEALYLQWQADLQLQGAAERARESGMEVGLYRDLAVSVDRGGAEAWSNRALYASAASVGAPPDAFSPKGQNWGLPPPIPHALRSAAYAPFIAMLRANMRHAGAVRIDHVMGLARLYWVPEGASAAEGAYVRYPLADLMGILALESQRQHCLVIGEDLGTVPDEVRDALRNGNVLSYRLLWFERDAHGDFLAPDRYPAQALVAASTHDLPTIAGWWQGRDIEAREARGLFADSGAAAREYADRARDRERLLRALKEAGVGSPHRHPGAPVPDASSIDLARRLQQFLATTPAQVMVVQLEDVVGVCDQLNLPGTTDSYPNWRGKLPLPLERWLDDARFEGLTRSLRRTRRMPSAAAAARRHAAANVPRATYRLQLHREFTLRDATALVPYLAALGISHVYCSPYLRARPGSRHGYDIVDHAALNPEIGDTTDLDVFVAALEKHGMAHLLDVVPNHMGVMGSDNAWWMDVLENGPASIYADHFDIDWTPRDPDAGPRLLIPILGDHYGNVLERGELRVGFEPGNGAFSVRYHTHRLPLDPRSYRPLLERARRVAVALAPSAARQFSALIHSLESLPPRHATAAQRMQARHEAKEALKAQLARLCAENDSLRAGIDVAVAEWNGTPGESATLDALHDLLEAQTFRVSFWRVASDEINYRRFFDINDLAALRIENDAVFEATHRFVLGLAASGKVAGLRIDHPDGLYDPAHYFERLQQHYAQATGRSTADAAHDKPLYVVVEKILASHEELPSSWAIHGTTGYRFANIVNGLFVDTDAKSRVDRAWRAFVRDEAVDFEAAVIAGKRAVMQGTLAAELIVLAQRLRQMARAQRHTRDFTLNVLRQALIEITAAFPVYRTYVSERVGPHDRRHIEWAVARAKSHSRAADVSVFEFIRSVLLMRAPAHAGDALRGAYRAFAMRFQQFTAPVTAKGVEDTALYRFNRLVSLNEVGGDPARFGTTVSAFHASNSERAMHWPHTLIASSTHDSKRSEDVRARIDLISEMPGAWRLLVRRWSRLNRSKKRVQEGRSAPSRNDEYLLYQTLLGTLPAGELDSGALATFRERIRTYAIKAAREAKVSTSWINV
ncbi:MAG: malto-oligosyltrehalose synthase, partial [Betaproteobacteria bacterium]